MRQVTRYELWSLHRGRITSILHIQAFSHCVPAAVLTQGIIDKRLSGTRELRIGVGRARDRSIASRASAVRLCRCAGKRLLKVGNNVVNVFNAHRNADQVLSHTTVCLLLVRKLLMRRAPWVNCKRLGITDAVVSTLALLDDSMPDRSNLLCKVRDQLEAVNHLCASRSSALDTERQDTAKALLEILLCRLVRSVAAETRVRHPGDVFVGLQPVGELQSVLSVTLSTQAESLDSEEKLLCSKGVQAGTKVT